MRPRIGYAKLGRSMPLSLDKCGSLGGDIEMVPTLKILAQRYPDVDFVLIGRNSGEDPADVGLPANVRNPWRKWSLDVRADLNRYNLNYPNLSIEDHIRVRQVLAEHTRNEFIRLDGMIMWLGQHGTTNTPLPSIRDRSVYTKPYDWATLYGSYLLDGINLWRDVDPLNREEILLNSDARNYVKYRDARWPWRHSVLAQYTDMNNTKHERWGHGKEKFEEFRDAPELSYARQYSGSLNQNLGYQHDGELWTARSHSVYSRLEISALMLGTPFANTVRFSDDFDRPHDFGMIVNETRREVNPAKARVNVIKEWVLPYPLGFIRGKWSDRSQRELGLTIKPVPQLEYIPLLQTTRCTLTTPASGSGWATAKPWESFAAGTICFFHPAYDDQDNILGDAPTELRQFLRVATPEIMRERIAQLSRREPLWRHYVQLQREHLQKAVSEECYLNMIMTRLGL